MPDSFKNTNKLSSLHFAWICMYMNTMLLFSREGSSITSVDAGSMWRIMLVVIAGSIALTGLTSRANAISNLFLRLPILGFFGYGMIGLISAGYSSLPFYTVWKALEILIVCLIAAIILSDKDNPASAKTLYNVSIFMIGLTLLAVILNVIIIPGLALRPVTGLFPFSVQSFKPHLNSNSVGSLAAITTFILYVRMLRCEIKYKTIYGVLCSVSFVLIVFSTSRTALAMIIGSVLVFAYFDRRYKLAGFLVVVAIIGASYKSVVDIATVLVTKDQNEELFLSMSGRTSGWQMAWDYFLESPLTGHGMAAAGRVDLLGSHGASTLHGAFFDVLVGVGLFGTLFWLMFLITPGIYLYMKGKKFTNNKVIRNVRAELLGLYSAIAIRTFTNSSLAFHDKETIVFLSIAVISVMGPRVYELIGSDTKKLIQEEKSDYIAEKEQIIHKNILASKPRSILHKSQPK